MKSTFAVVALVATTIGLAGAFPAVAQDTPTPVAARDSGPGMHRLWAPGNHPAGMGRAGGPLALACSDKGAEALDIALLKLSYRLKLTDTQKPLFDTFREKALTTETSFADTCEASRPDKSADAKPDMLARLKASLAIDQARLTALNDVLPDFEALYNSLTDAQKASIMPRGPIDLGGGMGPQGNWHRDGGMGRMARPPMPGRG